MEKNNYINLAGWIGVFLVLFGYYLNAHEMRDSWLIWIVGNSLVGFYSITKKVYPTAVMSFILVLLNIYGYVCWR